jgi:integrase
MGIEEKVVTDPRTGKKKFRYRMRVRVRLKPEHEGEPVQYFQRSSYHDTERDAKIAEAKALVDSRDTEGQKLHYQLLFQPTLERLLGEYFAKFSVKKAPTTQKSEDYLLKKVIPSVEINLYQCDDSDKIQTPIPDDISAEVLNFGLDKFPIGKIKIGFVRRSHLLSYIRKREETVSGDSIRKEIQLISSAFKKVPELFPKISIGIKNPRDSLTKADIPKAGKPRERVPTEKEKQALFEQAAKMKNPEMLAIIQLEILTAMRRGEILRIEWEHIDEEKHLLFIPKTKSGRARWVPLTDDAVAVLNRIAGKKKRKGKVFSLTSYGVATNWKRILVRAKLAGKDLRMHDLRHAALTDWASLGMNTPQIAALSGNADLRNFEHRHGPKLAAFALARKLKQGQSLTLKDIQAIGGHETMRMAGQYINLDSQKIAVGAKNLTDADSASKAKTLLQKKRQKK